jgi:hypothetical protein
MVQQITPVRMRSCYRCGFKGETAELRCPQCKRTLQTSLSIRIRGAVLTLCGVILATMMGYLSVWTLGVFNNPDASGARFNGTHEQKLIIIGLFASLLLFGAVSILTGMWQLILGRRNRIFVRAVIAAAVLVALGGGAVMLFFES